jgi:lysine N6-hydroxylase
MIKLEHDIYDLLGVGIGPFNLSLAALMSPLKSTNSIFFERRKSFVWHPGLLLPNAEIQVNYLKDLVTLVDPTNPYSFIAYLAKQKRLYRFMNSRFQKVLRAEFSQYLHWVSRSLTNLRFDEKVEDIGFDGSSFVVSTTARTVRGRHLALGSGLTPYVPECARQYLGENVYHSHDLLNHAADWKGLRVAVIGGGQSGAEAVHYILSDSTNLPKQLTWVTKRNIFSPMDDSVFANEYFTPNYSEYFFSLSEDKRQRLLEDQKLASDGISSDLLESIYKKLYIYEFIEQYGRFFRLVGNHELTNVGNNGNAISLMLKECDSGEKHMCTADIVILSTGYDWQMPVYLNSLSERIPLNNGRFIINSDYSIAWDGPESCRIYAQNAARHSHGIADPNLSLMAWRSAKIINSIVQDVVYDLANAETGMDWQGFAGKTEEETRYVACA